MVYNNCGTSSMLEIKNSFIRKSTRIPLKLKVLLNCEDKEIEAITHDISADGMFIEPQKSLTMNSLLNCYLFIPDREEPLSMLARVKYTGYFTYTGKESFYGAGLFFTQFTEETKELLKKFLEKQFYQCKNFRRPRKSGKTTESNEP
jgi:PilZ domain